MSGRGLVVASQDIRSRCGLMPDYPCHNCGSDRWWWRQNRYGAEWVCGRCHPAPDTRPLSGQTTTDDNGLQPLSAVLSKLPYISRKKVENESPGEDPGDNLKISPHNINSATQKGR